MAPAARQIVHRSPARSVRLIHLPHLQDKPVEAESSLEADFVHVAALFPRIRAIDHQPFRLELDGKNYTPDFLLRFADRSTAIVEVKPSSKLDAYEALFAKARPALGNAGIAFLVATEHQIRHDHLSDRARLIRRYAKSPAPVVQQERALELVGGSKSGLTFEELTAAQISRGCVLHLIAHRKLVTTPSLSLDNQTVVRLVQPPEPETCDALQFASWLDA